MKFVLIMLLLTITGCASNHRSEYDGDPGNCDRVSDYNISFTRFDEVAQQLAHATGCFIETQPRQSGDVAVNPVRGSLSIREALRSAIAGTDLVITSEGPDRITVNAR